MVVILALGVGTATARADDGEPPREPPRQLAYTGDLDGDYIYLGPVGAAVQIEDSWDSAFGAQLALLRVRERATLSAVGATFAASRYSARDGGRLSVEGLAGTRLLGDVMIGVSAGPAVELGDVHHPRSGFTGSAWLFAGVVPFVRGGWFVESGSYVELGVAIALPVRRW